MIFPLNPPFVGNFQLPRWQAGLDTTAAPEAQSLIAAMQSTTDFSSTMLPGAVKGVAATRGPMDSNGFQWDPATAPSCIPGRSPYPQWMGSLFVSDTTRSEPGGVLLNHDVTWRDHWNERENTCILHMVYYSLQSFTALCIYICIRGINRCGLQRVETSAYKTLQNYELNHKLSLDATTYGITKY